MISAMSVGHGFVLYSYTPEKLGAVPKGVEVRDANEVVGYGALARYFDGGWAALGTDFFRYAMQAKALGAWVDLDLYFIRPIDFSDDYIFGWEHETSIDGAVLRLPPDSAMVRDLCSISHLNWRPPFYGPRNTLVFYWRRMMEGDLRPEHYRWGTFGPKISHSSGEQVPRSQSGQGPFHLLPGAASPGQTPLRSARTRRKSSDKPYENSPPLAFCLECGGQTFAAAGLLPRGGLPSSWTRRVSG